MVGVPMLKAERISCSGPKLSDAQTRNFEAIKHSLDDVSDSEVQEVYDSLNRRPRKRLNWKCPWEVYHHQSLHLL